MKSITIDVEYEVGQEVYCITEPEEERLPFIVIGYYLVDRNIMYVCLRYGASTTMYPAEVSSSKFA